LSLLTELAKKRKIEKVVLAGRVASETSLSEEPDDEASSSDKDVRIDRLILGIQKENRDRTESLSFSDISNQTE
jgi:hypothetical protein